MPQLIYFGKRIIQSGKNILFVFFLMALFFALFDGTFSFMVPIVLNDGGLSKTLLGAIYASSSIFGAIIDYVISTKFPSIHFRKIFFFMFLACLVAPLVLLNGNSIFLYILAMAIWGMYYDFSSIGNADFLSRKTEKRDHAKRLGQLWVFRSLGYTIAPLVLSFVVIDNHAPQPYFLMWFYSIISILFFVVMMYLHKHHHHEELSVHRSLKTIRFTEFQLWKKIGRIVFPVLVLLIFCEVVDGFFWTIGPLIAEEIKNQHAMSGLFLTLYSLPPLLSGWIVGDVTKQIGKKKTALISLFVASILFVSFRFVHESFFLYICVFLASFAFSFALPAIYGAILDYIEETPLYEKELATIQDFSVNIGYVIGPLAAGIVADRVGNFSSFAVLGVVGIFLSLILYKITPKHLKVQVKE